MNEIKNNADAPFNEVSEKKMTTKELCAMLREETTVGDLMEQGYPKEEAEHILAIYKEGMNVYRWKHYMMQDKYNKLCVATCEKLLMGER
jgi:regulator of replication initiation timing